MRAHCRTCVSFAAPKRDRLARNVPASCVAGPSCMGAQSSRAGLKVFALPDSNAEDGSAG